MRTTSLAVCLVVAAATVTAETRPPAYTAERVGRTVRLADTRGQVVVSIAPLRGNVTFEMKVKGHDVLHFPVASLEDPRAGQFGIPFLGPWANRLDEPAFYANGRRYAFAMQLGNVRGSIPIHAFLVAAKWQG